MFADSRILVFCELKHLYKLFFIISRFQKTALKSLNLAVVPIAGREIEKCPI